MENNLNKLLFTGQINFFAHKADELWELFCDQLPSDEAFTIKDCAKLLMTHAGYTEKTATTYSRAIIANILKQDGEPVLRRIGKNYYFA